MKNTSNIPCRDCITYAVCKSRYLMAYKNAKKDSRHIDIACLIIARSLIRDKCSILDDYIKSFKRGNYGYRRFYSEFIHIYKDIRNERSAL